MGAQVEIVKGNMFDGASDLVVIPCSTIPTITWFVADHLKSFAIPEPHEQMQPGDILFADLRRANNIAQFAAYVASVRPRRVTPSSVIERIGQRLGQFAADNRWVSQISCPLLGTGAGGMEPTEAARALSSGYLAAAPDWALLRLFVLDETIYARIRGLLLSELYRRTQGKSEVVAVAERPLRVFVSYTKSTDEHRDWVKAMAAGLRSAGIDARLDVWHLRPGMDVAQWMCNELDMADRVLMVCDELYAQKADGRHGGVGWEIKVIQGDLLQSQVTNPDKFVPIVVTEDVTAGMPVFIKTVYCLHWPPSRRKDPALQDELVQIIYRAQEEAPPIGRPAYVIEQK
jgi:TIR domain